MMCPSRRIIPGRVRAVHPAHNPEADNDMRPSLQEMEAELRRLQWHYERRVVELGADDPLVQELDGFIMMLEGIIHMQLGAQAHPRLHHR